MTSAPKLDELFLLSKYRLDNRYRFVPVSLIIGLAPGTGVAEYAGKSLTSYSVAVLILRAFFL
ncbi:hypothetical protein D3C80_1016940 [compost metagenome]